jgi:hypothetical protein
MSKINNQSQIQEGKNNDGVLPGARTQAREILSIHKPKPLPDIVQAELDDILNRAARNLIPN